MLFAKLTIHVLDRPPLQRVWIHARQDEIEHAGPLVVTDLRDGLEDLVVVERDAQSLFTIQTEALVAQRKRDDSHVPALRSRFQDALEEIDGAALGRAVRHAQILRDGRVVASVRRREYRTVEARPRIGGSA